MKRALALLLCLCMVLATVPAVSAAETENVSLSTGAFYSTVEEALAAAEAGSTVTLQKDMTAGQVIVPKDVTLDLGGYNLTASLIVVVNGVICGEGNINTDENMLKIIGDNDGFLPVWDPANATYAFAAPSYQQMINVAEDGSSAEYIFVPYFTGSALELLRDGGADNGISVKVQMSWNNGASVQYYTFSDDLVATVYGGNYAQVFMLSITGISGIEDMVVSAIVESATGTKARNEDTPVEMPAVPETSGSLEIEAYGNTEWTAPQDGFVQFTINVPGATLAVLNGYSPLAEGPDSVTVQVTAGTTYGIYPGFDVTTNSVVTWEYVDAPAGGDEEIEAIPSGSALALGDNNVTLVYATMPMAAPYWTYTATENGNLTVTVSSINGDSNLGMAFGRGMYTLLVGETDGAFTNSATVYMNAGESVNIAVLDSLDMTEVPAVINLSFTAGEPVVEKNPADYFDTDENGYYVIGSLESPVDIFSGNNDVYFVYTAEASGTVTVTATVDEMTATNCWIKVGEGAWDYTASPAAVAAGDVVLINIWNGYEGTVSFEAGEVGPSEPVSVTETYTMSDYVVDGELGGGEFSRELGDKVVFTISSGWFTTQARIYKNANGVIASTTGITSLTLNVGNKDSSFNVYISEDGETWTEYQMDVAFTVAYSDVTIDFATPVNYIKLDAPNAQIRIQNMSITFAGGSTEAPSEPDGTQANPFVIDALPYTIEFFGGMDQYYVYTAEADGTIIVTALEGGILSLPNGEEWYYDANGNYAIDVTAGYELVLNPWTMSADLTGSMVVSLQDNGGTDEPSDPSDPYANQAAIMEQIKALAAGENLADVTLTGEITKINTAYDSFYQNVTVTISVFGTEDTLKCFRIKGDAASILAVGDTITVNGTVTNYTHSSGDTELEFIAGSLITEHIPAEGTVTPDPEEPPVDEPDVSDDPAADSTLTIADAIALGAGKESGIYTAGKYYVTGVITEVSNATYGNVYITDGNGNYLYVYGLYSADGEIRYDAMDPKPDEGDTVTLYGVIGKYNNDVQMKSAWVTAQTAGELEKEEIEGVTITFDDTAKRTEFDTSHQVWVENGVTVTNNKASSTSNVANYSNPVRFYKSSTVIVEYANGINQIVFDCNTASYANALQSSITSGTVTVENDKVTVVLDASATSFEVVLSGGQVRVDSITVS